MTDQEEIEAIRAVVANVAHHIDAKRWEDLRALYSSEVETDYTSLFGGTPAKQAADALIASWRGVLTNVATQHLLGPIEVRTQTVTAVARCHVRAFHLAPRAPGGAVWEVLGHYVFELFREPAAWKITKMKLETLLQTGNAQLLAEASAGQG